VPLTEPFEALFRDEYNRFMRGLDDLTVSDRDRLLQATRRDLQNARLPRVVEIPAWDDVLHITPRLSLTEQQRTEFYAARRQGRAANLQPEVIQEIERRRQRADSMRRSAQPEFDRAWGSVMTAIDNVQDFLAALSVFGRIALRAGPAIAGLLPETLAGALRLAAGLAPRAALRFVPGLGAIILAAELLSLVMMIGQFAFPAWLLLCAGPRQALRAGVGTALTNVAFRSITKNLARGSAKGLFWTARAPVTTRGISGLIGAALVIGQTTDQLFGYGISLGPIVGTTMGTAYGLEARARGEQIELRRSPSGEHFRPRALARLRELPTQALYERITAADVWAQSALILHPESGATDRERVLTLAALAPALSTLYEDWHGTNWQDELPRLAGWRPPAPGRAAGRLSWQDFVEDRDSLPVPGWPKGWGGGGYDIDQAAKVIPDATTAALARVTRNLPSLPERSFAEAAMADAAETEWLLLTDDPDSFRASLPTGWKAAERMTAVGFLPHPGQRPEDIQAWWDTARAKVENSRHGMQTLAEWRELADAHKVDYIVALPPTYTTTESEPTS
jgi:hypothetical protein